MPSVTANTSAYRGPFPLKKRNLVLHRFKFFILKVVSVYNILATSYHPKPFPTPEKCFWSCAICNVYWRKKFCSIFKYNSGGGSRVGSGSWASLLVGLWLSGLTMGSILVCLAGTSASVAVEADARVTVFCCRDRTCVLSLVCRSCHLAFCGPASLWRLVSSYKSLL